MDNMIVDLIFKKDYPAINDFKNHSKQHTVLKSRKWLLKRIANFEASVEEVLAYFQENYPKLAYATLDCIRLFALQSVDIKLGEIRYSQIALKTFEAIHSLLEQKELVCVSTKNKLVKGSKTGLINSHVYSVINAYKRGNNYFLLISNPHQRYSQGYELVESHPQKLKPLLQHAALFNRGRSIKNLKRIASQPILTNLACKEEQDAPDQHLDKPGNFEIELNIFMQHFDYYFTTELHRSIKLLSSAMANESNAQTKEHIQLQIQLMAKLVKAPVMLTASLQF